MMYKETTREIPCNICTCTTTNPIHKSQQVVLAEHTRFFFKDGLTEEILREQLEEGNRKRKENATPVDLSKGSGWEIKWEDFIGKHLVYEVSYTNEPQKKTPQECP